MYNSINSIKFIKRKNCIDIFNKDGKYLIVQAPKGFCNKKIQNNSNYIWISFLNENKIKKEFYDFLSRFKLNIENLLQGKSVQSFYYENGMGITIQNYKGNNIVDLYYNKDTPMEIIDCPERYYIKPLIWFQNAKCVNDKWYINYSLIQAIIYPIYLKLGKCFIEDNQPIEEIYKKRVCLNKENETLEHISYIHHPIYGKYFKMLNMGIPKGAIQIKITNEIGEKYKDILEHNSDDLIIIRKIKQLDHPIYNRFFKMLSMGIPKMAVEQKMCLENIDKDILNEPEKLIMDLPIIGQDFSAILISKKLRKMDIKPKNKIQENKIQEKKIQEKKIIHGLHFCAEDILKMREQILNKLNK
jgi:hypothetical protein